MQILFETAKYLEKKNQYWDSFNGTKKDTIYMHTYVYIYILYLTFMIYIRDNSNHLLNRVLYLLEHNYFTLKIKFSCIRLETQVLLMYYQTKKSAPLLCTIDQKSPPHSLIMYYSRKSRLRRNFPRPAGVPPSGRLRRPKWSQPPPSSPVKHKQKKKKICAPIFFVVLKLP